LNIGTLKDSFQTTGKHQQTVISPILAGLLISKPGKAQPTSLLLRFIKLFSSDSL
jgi:hypothetical protein